MLFEVKVPAVGESVTEGVILTWFKSEGESVAVDDPLFELETDKITLTVPAEMAGVIQIKQPEGAEVEVGQVAAIIDTEAAASVGATKEAAPVIAADVSPVADNAHAIPAAFDHLLSPAARVLVLENNIDVSSIRATGKDGRILKEDVLRLINGTERTQVQTPKPAPKPAAPAKPAAAPAPQAPATVGPDVRQTRKKMTPIRKRIAQRLIQAQSEAAILTTFNEVDMTNIMALRKQYQDSFVKKYGIKLGFMSFFVKAVVDALQNVPGINAFIEGDEIVQNHFYDIGIAVGTERGLVVPVVRNADQLNFAEVEMEIGNLAKKARDKRLTLDDLSGGSFSITNGGIYGSLLSTPILNPPQSGILGMHGIKKRPVAVGDKVEIRPMMYLALSYDHRLVDGKEAVTFLKRIVECIENPERILLDV